jgi:hypothetical protein
MGRTVVGALTAPGPSRFFLAFGGIVLAGVLVYYAFMAVDGMGLTDQQGTGTVLSKEHRAPGRSYSTQIVGNRTLVVPQTTSDAYVLRLDILGLQAGALVDKQIYDNVLPNSQVIVTFQRRRLTGAIQVMTVTR